MDLVHQQEYNNEVVEDNDEDEDEDEDESLYPSPPQKRPER